MDLGSIFLILGLLLLVGLYVARPLLEKRPVRSEKAFEQEQHEYSTLLAERDRLLNALQELDFDFSLGKIPAEDYPAQRASLLQRGAGILRQLDAMETPSAVHPASAASTSAEERMEQAVAARRLAPTAVHAAPGGNGNSLPPAEDELEILIASRRRNRQEKAAGFCPQCGSTVQKSDRFCPKCGTNVGE